jgi:STE24 endopeptidase
MTYNVVFYAIVLIIVLNYLLEQWLDWLNAKNRTAELPEELQGIYDDEKYKKSIDYDKVNSKFGFYTGSFNLLLTLVVLFLGGFALADNLAGQISVNPIWRGIIFFAIIGLVADLLNTPFSIYHTFVIEQKFGFNKTTVKTFILDKLKGWLISGLIGGVLLAVILWFYYKTTNMFWIYAWVLTSVFMVFFVMFYSNLIVPLFNKQEPLEDGELKDAIQNFAVKAGFKLDNVYKIDGSKRSTKANAYFTGLGSKKRIVLFDTLIKELSVPEIVAVLAHEIGHYKHKHTRQSLVISVFQMGVMFFLISLFVRIPALSQALGVVVPSFHIGLIAFGILYSPFSTIIGLAMNVLSRKNEYEADAFTRKNFEPEHLINALKKLSVNNLSNLTPHPYYVFFNYSHPTLLQRIKAMRKVE